MKIIKLPRNYLDEALNLVWNVFQEFESPEYSKEGIEEFKNFIRDDSIRDKFDNEEMFFWACFDNNNIVGVIASRNINHISMLFVDKRYHKKGIGRNLFRVFEEECKNKKDIENITVNSSPYAVGFYHKIGFKDLDKEQTVNGIRFVPMSYSLL